MLTIIDKKRRWDEEESKVGVLDSSQVKKLL